MPATNRTCWRSYQVEPSTTGLALASLETRARMDEGNSRTGIEGRNAAPVRESVLALRSWVDFNSLLGIRVSNGEMT